MVLLRQVMLILALISFVLAAFEVQTPRVNLIAAGLAFFTIAQLIP